jgi:hypothetical protein
MLFVDFYEWLSFLGEISNKTDYDWYIKPHPDFLPGTIETLDEICKKFPKISLIDPITSWHQLKDEGVEIALTCYGSIGHELPLLGLKVINAAYNPHIAYEFNWHPKTKDELESLIINLEGLGSIRDVERVYEFFYVHKFMVQKDDLIFPSYEDSLKNINNSSFKANCYEYFLKNSELIEAKAKITTDKFIKSDATYYYELQMNNE